MSEDNKVQKQIGLCKPCVPLSTEGSGLCKVLNHSLEKVGADDYVRFTTTHFSTFAIVDKAEAEKLIAAQNADHIKALMQNLLHTDSSMRYRCRNASV